MSPSTADIFFERMLTQFNKNDENVFYIESIDTYLAEATKLSINTVCLFCPRVKNSISKIVQYLQEIFGKRK